VLAWFVFLWSKELWGWRGGLFSMGLYSLEPNLLAHARWVTNDIAVSLFMLATVVWFLRYLRDRTNRNLIVCAMLAGCAQIAKQNALLLLPVLVVLAGVYTLDKIPSGGRLRFIRAHLGVGTRHAVVFVLVVVLVINAGYFFNGTGRYKAVSLLNYFSKHLKLADTAALPQNNFVRTLVAPLGSVPVPLPFVYIQTFEYGVRYNEQGLGHAPNYLLGEVKRDGWWYYFLVALAFKVPLGLWLLMGLSVVETIKRRRESVVEVALILLPLALIVFMSASTAQIGVRYVLPILPFLIVSLGRLVVDFHQRSLVYRSYVVVACGWIAVSSLSFYPHYLTYFNELVGNRLHMYKILADSNVDWQQNEYYLEDYLRNNAGKVIHVNPDKPTTGTVVVGVNYLVGVLGTRERYAWLRDSGEPVGHIGYSWLIYEVH
jgi:hypothetical protein